MIMGHAGRHRMLGAWRQGTVGSCWQRDARAYYIQDIWTRVTAANEDLVWDTPASVHVMFTWALGTRGLMQGLLAWAVRQYRKAHRKCSLCTTLMREGHSAGSAPASNTEEFLKGLDSSSGDGTYSAPGTTGSSWACRAACVGPGRPGRPFHICK